jgi:hypothetical protein
MSTPGAPDLSGVEPSKLSALLRLAAPEARSREGLVGLLREPSRLREVLDAIEVDGLRFGVAGLALVTAGAPEMPALVELKDRAKRARAGSTEPHARDACLILYHAAIAAAFGAHGENISSRPLEDRLPAYADMAEMLPPGPLRAVFTRARDRHQAEA